MKESVLLGRKFLSLKVPQWIYGPTPVYQHSSASLHLTEVNTEFLELFLSFFLLYCFNLSVVAQ